MNKEKRRALTPIKVERDLLEGRIISLRKSIRIVEQNKVVLDDTDRKLIIAQIAIMEAHLRVLDMRIENYEKLFNE